MAQPPRTPPQPHVEDAAKNDAAPTGGAEQEEAARRESKGRPPGAKR